MTIHKGHWIHKGHCVSKRPLQLPVNLTVVAVIAQDQLLIECNITSIGDSWFFFLSASPSSPPLSEFKDNNIKF